jgi:hypothetical protein
MKAKPHYGPFAALSLALSALAVSGFGPTSMTMAQEAPIVNVVEVLPRPEPTAVTGVRLGLSDRDVFPFYPKEEGRALLAPAQFTIGPDDKVIVCPSPYFIDNGHGLMRRLN